MQNRLSLLYILPLIFLCFGSITASAKKTQKAQKVRILNADSLVFEKDRGNDLRRLYGHVKFKHKDAVMSCDSAYFYSKANRFVAFDNIHINQSDTLHVYGDSLDYDGKTGIAKLRGSVKMVDSKMTLTTNYLDYDAANSYGYYYGGGRIVNTDNRLTSKIGYYYSNTNTLFFKDSVRLINDDYWIDSDTLKYQVDSEMSYFFGPTTILSDNDFIYCENGWYDGINENAQFGVNAYLNSKEQYLYGDSLYYDRNKGIGEAFRNVLIRDTLQQLDLHGQYGFLQQKPEYCYVTDSILLVKPLDNDTLFLHSDSIVCYQDTIDSARVVMAYKKVRFYKTDVQGKCDSLVYHFRDSSIEMHTKPVLWSDNNQISGKKITINIKDNQVDRLTVSDKSFLVSQDSLFLDFNQIRGKKLIGFFKNQNLKRVEMHSNSEAIYHMIDGDEKMGVNKVQCSLINIYFEKGKLYQIDFKKSPSGTIYPDKYLTKKELYLNGFSWLKRIRPQNATDVFNWKE